MTTTVEESPVKVLTRSEIFDLFALDRDVRKSTGGIGFFTPPVARIFEKAALLGESSLNVDEVGALFAGISELSYGLGRQTTPPHSPAAVTE